MSSLSLAVADTDALQLTFTTPFFLWHLTSNSGTTIEIRNCNPNLIFGWAMKVMDGWPKGYILNANLMNCKNHNSGVSPSLESSHEHLQVV